jgi:hypothetical protein
VCFGLICMWVLSACISWESTLIVGNFEKQPQSIEITRWIMWRRVVVFCKTCEAVIGELVCVVFLFYVLSSWEMVSGTPYYVICLGWRICVTKCKQELGFLWKSDMVLGSCGLKNLRRRRKANGFKREIKAIWPLRDLKCLFVEKKLNLGGHKFMLVGDSENVFPIQYMCVLCAAYHVP